MCCSLSTQQCLTRPDRMRAYPVSTYSTTPTVFRGARGRCLAVALDGMVFHEPVYVGDEVGRYAAILRAGKTSITVRIEAWRRGRTAEDKYNGTEATFTFVALDEDRKSRLVPSALIRGTLEQALYPSEGKGPLSLHQSSGHIMNIELASEILLLCVLFGGSIGAAMAVAVHDHRKEVKRAEERRIRWAEFDISPEEKDADWWRER